jgi:hypothetical protein
MTNLFILLFSIFVFVGFIIYVIETIGVLPSISESYYHLPENRKWLFTLITWGYAIPIMIVGDCGMLFFAGAFICFVGAAPAFKETFPDMDGIVHVVGAVGGISLSMMGIWFGLHLWYVPIIMAIFFLYSKSKWNKFENSTLLVEILAYVLTIYSLAVTKI